MNLTELYAKANYQDEMGMLFHGDCMNIMNDLKSDTQRVALTITDIPYDSVNRSSNGLRKLDKGNADILTFNLQDFLNNVYEITNGTIIIFCAKEQLSEVYSFFVNKQNDKEGTVRHLTWAKTNPSPMNGDYIYLSATENAVWFKKKGATFNAHCKKIIFCIHAVEANFIQQRKTMI